MPLNPAIRPASPDRRGLGIVFRGMQQGIESPISTDTISQNEIKDIKLRLKILESAKPVVNTTTIIQANDTGLKEVRQRLDELNQIAMMPRVDPFEDAIKKVFESLPSTFEEINQRIASLESNIKHMMLPWWKRLWMTIRRKIHV